MPERGRLSFRAARVEGIACRHPLAVPVSTSFGIMRDRPAVFVRIEDGEGGFGWGEAFANWPAAGAEHRVNLLIDDVAPLLLGRVWDDPATMSATLASRTRIRALQCGEPGPFAQVIAALDIAAWDLVARRAGVPLVRLLARDDGEGAVRPVPAYASGIHVDAARDVVPAARARGFRAFKVKVGFDAAADPDKVVALANELSDGERLFADANQAWDVSGAEDFLERSRAAKLGWMEEPIAADAPDADWVRLARLGVPLAGGENLAGARTFEGALRLGALQVVQPDVIKWGGVSGCLAVARRVRERGRRYCPHYLGAGIGLAASAHVLAAAGGDGLLELDVNPNPLREAFEEAGKGLSGGAWRLGDEPGLGIEALPDALEDTVTIRRRTQGP